MALRPCGKFWTSGPKGQLSPWAKAVVYGLHRASTKLDLELSHTDIAAEVEVIGGGHPTQGAIGKLRAKFDADSAWYPGKERHNAKRRGPKPMFTPSKKRGVARTAMSIKESGVEPTVSEVKARNSTACANDATGEPFSDKYILQVFRTLCYDNDPSVPWSRTEPLQKTALSPVLEQFRYGWSGRLLRLGYSEAYVFRHIVGTLVGEAHINPVGARSNLQSPHAAIQWQ
jgi:hypothetical protein